MDGRARPWQGGVVLPPRGRGDYLAGHCAATTAVHDRQTPEEPIDMTLFRLALAGFWLVLLVYTAVVIANHGMNLLPIFFGDIAAMGWPGQFNLDFLGFLLLAALWTAWRNGFSGAGWALAVAASLGGIGFMAPYLLYLTYQTNGDVRAMLLGVHR
jgi:hypothetical protein